MTGDYTVVIRAAGESIVGKTITRGAARIEVRATIGGTGFVTIDPLEDVLANFSISGPGDTDVPDSYDTGRRLVESLVVWSIPAAGATALDDPNDPCATSNQQRGKPIAVVVMLDTSANTIPGFGADDGPSATFYVACPAAAAVGRVEGKDLDPEDSSRERHVPL